MKKTVNILLYGLNCRYFVRSKKIAHDYSLLKNVILLHIFLNYRRKLHILEDTLSVFQNVRHCRYS